MDETIKDDEAAFQEPEEDQTPAGEDQKPKEVKAEDEAPRRSEIAQKIKWRERAIKAEEAASKVERLEAELQELRGAVKKPTDDQEAKAQEYIRKQAREVYEELQNLKQKEEKTQLAKFEAEVESIIDENPDVSETELLDAIEEYEVEPKVALKILQRQTDKTKKPKMPAPKRGTSEPSKEKPDDSKKTMWEILREETSKLKSS